MLHLFYMSSSTSTCWWQRYYMPRHGRDQPEQMPVLPAQPGLYICSSPAGLPTEMGLSLPHCPHNTQSCTPSCTHPKHHRNPACNWKNIDVNFGVLLP